MFFNQFFTLTKIYFISISIVSLRIHDSITLSLICMNSLRQQFNLLISKRFFFSCFLKYPFQDGKPDGLTEILLFLIPMSVKQPIDLHLFHKFFALSSPYKIFSFILLVPINKSRNHFIIICFVRKQKIICKKINVGEKKIN